MRRRHGYLRWIGLCAAMMIVALLIPRPQSREDDASSAWHVKNRKVRRTAGSFAELAPIKEDQPLYTIDDPAISIALEMDEQRLEQIMFVFNRDTFKERATNISVRFADRAPRPAVMTLRGGGSLKDETRPNFNIKLVGKEAFAPDLEMKHFYLMNMRSDKHHVEMAWAYGLLRELSLLHFYTRYAKVSVNGRALGLYLVVEPPASGIRRTHSGCVSVYRRRRPNVYITEWTAATPLVGSSLSELRSLNYQDDVADPIAAYEKAIDLDAYLRWTAFNAIIMNRDSTDELFLFEVRDATMQPRPLRVMAWDYDDIGISTQKSGAIKDALLFSTFGDMDAAIQRYPELYERYRQTLKGMLTRELAIERLTSTLDEARRFRDGLDDGRDAAVQAEEATERAAYVARMGDRIRERHAELLELLKDVDAPAEPVSRR